MNRRVIGAEFLRPDALPGVNNMRVMQYQIVLNIALLLLSTHSHDPC